MEQYKREFRGVQKTDDNAHWKVSRRPSEKAWSGVGWKLNVAVFTKQQRDKLRREKIKRRRASDPEFDAEYRRLRNEVESRRYHKRTEQQRIAERAAERARYHTRLKQTPEWKVKHNLRIRLRKFLFGHKSLSMPELLGCSQPTLIKHLEKHMKRGMTWKNYGTTWHIDHILPCASFDLTDPDQQRKCFHFSNLRPEWAQVNQSKGKKIVACQPELLLAV